MNVGSLLFLFMFMYAVMGMSLFGPIKYGDNLNRHANFRNLISAMLTLFRCVAFWRLFCCKCFHLCHANALPVRCFCACFATLHVYAPCRPVYSNALVL